MSMYAHDGHASQPRRRPPARSLGAVEDAIYACADSDVVAEFKAARDLAWQDATDRSSLEPLSALVEAWWPTAALWTVDPEQTRRVRHQMAVAEREGLPASVREQLAKHPEGMTRERAIAMWEAANGRPMHV